MKTIITMLFAFTMVFLSHAKIWRVNNTPGVNADYTTIQAAHDAADAGDTIYVEPSAEPYSHLYCAKSLVIIGGGYDRATYFPQYYHSQLQTVVASGDISFNSGSSGSILIGFNAGTYGIKVNVPGITIIGCTMYDTRSGTGVSYTNYEGLVVKGSNTIISQSIIRGIYIEAGKTGLIFRNSYFRSSIYDRSISSSTESIWYNNIFNMSSATLTFNEQTLYNNINIGNLPLENCNLSNNIDARLGSEVFGTNNGNFGNIDPDDVFSEGETALKYYQLNETSPALEAGMDDADCGMFGGDTPFVLSGIPPIPWITKFYNPGAGSDSQPLQITISVESRN